MQKNTTERNNINNKKQAFDDLSVDYEKARPTYPKELYIALLTVWKKGHKGNIKTPLVVDVGCGTGISTRAIYHALAGQCDVYGVEPGDAMRGTAEEITKESIKYINASAEKLPFEEGTVDIVTAAQAAQWFDRPKFYAEVLRILKFGGIVAIYENNRDWQNSEFLAKHETFLETYADKSDGTKYSRYYRDFDYAGELKKIFHHVETQTFTWERKMLPEAFLTLAKSSTQVQRAIKNLGNAKAESLILENVNAYCNVDGTVDILYNTKLITAKK